MEKQIHDELSRLGWDHVYERHVRNLSPANASGERRCVPPFPDHGGSSDSLCINIVNGLWRDFSSSRGGDYILFRAILDAEEFEEGTGRAIVNYAASERAIARELGLSHAINPEWLAYCQGQIESEAATRAMRGKPWVPSVLARHGVGFDMQRSRFVLPVCDNRGRVVNTRMYQPGGTPKNYWLAELAGGNFLFPYSAHSEPILILCEGEPDALSLLSHGLAACSGTLGAGQPVPEGNWWFNKTIYVLMDSDAAGEQASADACRKLVERAQSVVLCHLPTWAGMPPKADVSDYITYLYSQGNPLDVVQQRLLEILTSGSVVSRESSQYDQEPVEVPFSSAISSVNGRQRLAFSSRVTARGTKRYSLPVEYEVTCPAQGHAYCAQCPMRRQFQGNARFTHDPRSHETLKMIHVTDMAVRRTIQEMNNIPGQCPDVRIRTVRSVDVEPLVLNDSSVGWVSDDAAASERKHREAYCILRPGDNIEENGDYRFEGFTYPHPLTQHSVFLLDRYVPKGNQFENFEPTPSDLNEMYNFRPLSGQSVIEKLQDVADDLAYSTTLIRGREDLHLAYRTMWHSVLNFKIFGTPIGKGWIEMLVIGDTRVGKSSVFKALAGHYNLGVMIDCKMQTIPGILGSVVQMPTGEYYAVAGILPQQDRGVVCFDEFSTLRYAGQSLIETLSSTRSEGIVRITKAATAEFRARVRSVWLANPGKGKLMSEMASTGVEIIHDVIEQPEDIARFDYALALAQSDVPVDEINAAIHPMASRYSQRAAQNLLSWTYSRRPDQIVWLEASEAEVIEASRRMCARYDSTIPLVEPAEQRKKIAKMAVSIAAQTFSCDPNHQLLIVHPEHVNAAEWMLHRFYTKAAMGYHHYSERARNGRVLDDIAPIRASFDNDFPDGGGRRFAMELMRLEEFSMESFVLVSTLGAIGGYSLLSQLQNFGCIQLVEKGKRNNFEKTPAFIHFLREYLALDPSAARS